MLGRFLFRLAKLYKHSSGSSATIFRRLSVFCSQYQLLSLLTTAVHTSGHLRCQACYTLHQRSTRHALLGTCWRAAIVLVTGHAIAPCPAQIQQPLSLALQADPGGWLTATFTTPLVAPATAFPILFSGGGIYRNGAMRQAAPLHYLGIKVSKGLSLYLRLAQPRQAGTSMADWDCSRLARRAAAILPLAVV